MKLCKAQWIVLILLLLGWATSLAAQESLNNRVKYKNCVELGATSPQAAFDMGIKWRDEGGGLPAQHCAALALVGLGLYEEAAQELDVIASDLSLGKGLGLAQMIFRGDRKVLADIYLQSGNVWLLAMRPIMAYDALSQGLAVADNASEQILELYVDRARASGLSGDYQLAIDDLNMALALAPERADIYIFIATAQRALENFNEATLALNKALSISPDNPEALLERGNIRFAMGDIDAARLAWVGLISLHPDHFASKTALDNIEKLDALEAEVSPTQQ